MFFIIINIRSIRVHIHIILLGRFFCCNYGLGLLGYAFREVEGHLVALESFKVKKHNTMGQSESRKRNHLHELHVGLAFILGEQFFLVVLHVANEVDMRYLSVEALLGAVLIFADVEVKAARIILGIDHKWVALLERIDPQSIWSCWAEMTHL